MASTSAAIHGVAMAAASLLVAIPPLPPLGEVAAGGLTSGHAGRKLHRLTRSCAGPRFRLWLVLPVDLLATFEIALVERNGPSRDGAISIAGIAEDRITLTVVVRGFVSLEHATVASKPSAAEVDSAAAHSASLVRLESSVLYQHGCTLPHIQGTTIIASILVALKGAIRHGHIALHQSQCSSGRATPALDVREMHSIKSHVAVTLQVPDMHGSRLQHSVDIWMPSKPDVFEPEVLVRLVQALEAPEAPNGHQRFLHVALRLDLEELANLTPDHHVFGLRDADRVLHLDVRCELKGQIIWDCSGNALAGGLCLQVVIAADLHDGPLAHDQQGRYQGEHGGLNV
eukprot:CAMPEP_0198493326 /NCGR_PEP_ID=MMETSP1462-20131121/3949_1 /TAXON_ID=1333877 /ORGANISM="Brandtodinium nutriculum, Strain RCC3387" /LENGTH=342 /DNA_ID=CAMNT_0044222007 /DNA_START=165 /DNA_END=1192 /DNA_ORIENTATION=-